MIPLLPILLAVVLGTVVVLAGCEWIDDKPAVGSIPDISLPSNLLFCNLNTHTPAPLPTIKASKQLIDGYNELELSREAIISELRECDSKRAKLVEKLMEFEGAQNMIPIRSSK